MPFIKTGDSQPVTYYDDNGKELSDKDLQKTLQESDDKSSSEEVKTETQNKD